MPPFKLADVERLRQLQPKRRRFDESTDALNGDGSFSLSFRFETVARLFQKETGLATRNGIHGPWGLYQDQKDIDVAQDWKKRRGKLIFLRDNLDFSMALDFNFLKEGEYTELGSAEHYAKQQSNERAIEYLAAQTAGALKDLPPYLVADALCAVPPCPSKSWDLPTEIVRRIAADCGKDNLSDRIAFKRKKESVKALSLAEKWKALEAAECQADPVVKGKTIVLIDDKYQSGTTAQFVASKLYDAGAKSVLGLYCVKTWRDTDNT